MADRKQHELPLTIEDIDAEWLTDALSSHVPGITVKDFEITDVVDGFSTILRIHPEIHDPKGIADFTQTIIVKGGFATHSRERARTYFHEAHAYRDLWPHLGLNVPKTYFVGEDHDRKQAIIIMEDLAQRGVTFGHLLRPLHPEQMKRSLSALAALHAKTWNSPDLAPGGRWNSDVPTNGTARMRDYLHQVGYFEPDVWERFVGLPRGAATSVRFHDREWFSQAMDVLATLSERLPQCIVHGDAHVNNMYLEADGTPGFYDTLPRVEPPFFELAYHITTSLDPGDRRDWDTILVQHYLEELASHGIDAPEFDETMRHFALYLPHGHLVFFINEAHYQPEAVSTACTARFSAAMLDHHTKELFSELAS